MAREVVDVRTLPIPFQISKIVLGGFLVAVLLRSDTWWAVFAAVGLLVAESGVKGLYRRLFRKDDVSLVDLGPTIPIELSGGPFGIRLVRCDKPVTLANALWDTFGKEALSPIHVADLRAGSMLVASIPADEVRSIELELTSSRRAWDIELVRMDGL